MILPRGVCVGAGARWAAVAPRNVAREKANVSSGASLGTDVD